MTLTVISYIIYLIIGLAIVFWVAEVLFRNARIFMDDIFKGDQDLSDSTNKLLKLGFYLLNIGFILFLLEHRTVANTQVLFELLSIKIGRVILIVGVLFLLNVYTFIKYRNRVEGLNKEQIK